MVTFSNPRLVAKFDNWPYGFRNVCTCTFTVEHNPKKGFRVLKQTVGKPKASTYSGRCCIVDGSNGKTYIIQRSLYGPTIYVNSHDFKTPTKDELGFDHSVPQKSATVDLEDHYWQLSKLIHEAHNQVKEEVTDEGTLVAFDSTRVDGEK